MDPKWCIGRCAKLIDIEDRPELNGLHVDVCSHIRSNLFEVKVKNQECVHVTFDQLQFYTSIDFHKCFPSAISVKGSHHMTEFPNERVIDFSATKYEETNQLITVNGSCKIVGTKRINSNDGLLKSCCTMANPIVINTAKGDDIVEFNNICFRNETNTKPCIECLQGYTVFRMCQFHDYHVGATVGQNKDESVNVVFERCVFHNMNKCGVMLRSGSVTLVNCNFMKIGIGVAVQNSAHLVAMYCTFDECVGGVVIPSTGSAIIDSCALADVSDYGILASNKSHVRIEECHIRDCRGDGCVIEGGYAEIDGCELERCRSGVRLCGHIHATILNAVFTQCTLGLYSCIDSVGRVSLSLCEYTNCKVDNVILSGDRCKVTIDNITQPGTQIATLHSTRALFQEYGVRYGYPVSGNSKQVLHSVGFSDIVCTQCKSVAPNDVMYQKCARCRDTRYCSRACQEAHWIQHKV